MVTKKPLPGVPVGNVTIGVKSLQYTLANGESSTIPFHGIAYFTEIPASSILNADRRLKIVTSDGQSHSIAGGTVVDAFKTAFSNWMNLNTFTL
jgi:hypothetical protein